MCYTSFFNPKLSQPPFWTIKWHSTWLYCALYQNCKDGGHFDLHFPYLGDLQCVVHLFLTRNRVRHPLEPLKWHPTWLYCALYPNYKNGGLFDLNFFYLGHLQCDVHCFSTQIWVKHPEKPQKRHPTCFQVKMVIWWQCYVKSFKTTLGCCILKFQESILDFGGHGGQMEVKTRLDCFGDGIFEKYGQK